MSIVLSVTIILTIAAIKITTNIIIIDCSRIIELDSMAGRVTMMILDWTLQFMPFIQVSYNPQLRFWRFQAISLQCEFLDFFLLFIL